LWWGRVVQPPEAVRLAVVVRLPEAVRLAAVL
jgi:hypothetical protein